MSWKKNINVHIVRKRSVKNQSSFVENHVVKRAEKNLYSWIKWKAIKCSRKWTADISSMEYWNMVRWQCLLLQWLLFSLQMEKILCGWVVLLREYRLLPISWLLFSEKNIRQQWIWFWGNTKCRFIIWTRIKKFCTHPVVYRIFL